MMRVYYLYLILPVCLYTNLAAQKSTSVVKRFSADRSLIIKGIYRFPAFTDGTVVLRNGIVYAGQLNYNVVGDEMQFINEQGDTVAVADPVTIHFISLQGSRFYYEKGHYLQTISTEKDNPDITLACNRQFFRRPKVDANFTAPDTVAGQYFSPEGQRYKLESDIAIHTMVIVKEYYFFADKYAHFTTASQHFILQHYYWHEQAIRAFVKSSKINFEKPEDLMKLLRYCSGLGGR